MFILVIMALGAVVGFFLFPDKKLKWCERIQFICIYLLIFSMGIILGSRENFIEELMVLGANSFIFAVVSIIFSVILVFFLTKKFLYKKGGRK